MDLRNFLSRSKSVSLPEYHEKSAAFTGFGIALVAKESVCVFYRYSADVCFRGKLPLGREPAVIREHSL